MEEHRDNLMELEQKQTGKPSISCLGDVSCDIQDSIDYMRYFATVTDKIYGKNIMQDDCVMQTKKYPIGVVAAITPWNYPLMMAVWKLGPALSMGCTVVIKPSEFTPLTTLYLAKLISLTGFPKGTVNVVCGARKAG